MSQVSSKMFKTRHKDENFQSVSIIFQKKSDLIKNANPVYPLIHSKYNNTSKAIKLQLARALVVKIKTLITKMKHFDWFQHLSSI